MLKTFSHRFNDDVRNVVDKAVEHGENSLWRTLKNRANARDSAVEIAERAAREAQEKISKLWWISFFWARYLF